MTPLEQIPWIAALLTNPSYETSPLHDNLLPKALNTPDAIPYCILQSRVPPHSSQATSPTLEPTHELRLFASLGQDVAGHSGVLHGGVVASLLDSVMGLVLASRGQACMTASLNVRFRRPVPAPGAVVVQSWVKEERAGRWIVLGEIVDQTGKVLAGAEGMFVGVTGRPSRV
ncbi:hypothetical protein P168DRAFT_321358 [Aspergillus campestris IBT 28561]|uniref:Thioesterase domain-containing protein n=1 Tax=Aspergillus campestris (strain IBT 28561) TaxID=1392248 RepID=A0A2I1CVZ9_ASPC2|nr:uncharacterized protein P168DRAFT_321358 [Aspergillus campestris IBT 28561]PKY01788.1 hypothetical protein P168DRAFT_321358 [Aspergillus campestris IBT 28561]